LKKFAQIIGNKVHWIFDKEEKPEFAPYIIIKDITNITPQPQEGWFYDEVEDSYSEVGKEIIVAEKPTLESVVLENERLKANQDLIMGVINEMILGGGI
jgi:hypothetical protein